MRIVLPVTISFPGYFPTPLDIRSLSLALERSEVNESWSEMQGLASRSPSCLENMQWRRVVDCRLSLSLTIDSVVSTQACCLPAAPTFGRIEQNKTRIRQSHRVISPSIEAQLILGISRHVRRRLDFLRTNEGGLFHSWHSSCQTCPSTIFTEMRKTRAEQLWLLQARKIVGFGTGSIRLLRSILGCRFC